MLSSCTDRLLQRNLLYTAVTRAKQYCAIIGMKDVVDTAIDTNDIELRNSLLSNCLKHFDEQRYRQIHEDVFIEYEEDDED